MIRVINGLGELTLHMKLKYFLLTISDIPYFGVETQFSHSTASSGSILFTTFVLKQWFVSTF